MRIHVPVALLLSIAMYSLLQQLLPFNFSLTRAVELSAQAHLPLSLVVDGSLTSEISPPMCSPPVPPSTTSSHSLFFSVTASMRAVQPLTPQEIEAAWILTGYPQDPSDLFTPATASAFRRALQGVAETLISYRLSMQRSLFIGDCSAYLPCPYPNSEIRQQKPGTDSVLDMYQWLQHHNTLSSSSARYQETSMADAPSFFFFHSASPDGGHFIPGEKREGQQLALRFQEELYMRQHPADCSKAPILIIDYLHSGGGFGSWSRARAVALGLGIQGERTVVEIARSQGHAQDADDNCTRIQGLGICDIFLAVSACELPSSWKELVARDAAEFEKSHSPWRGGTVQQHLAYFRDRRFLLYTEVYLDGESYASFHTVPTDWDQAQLSTRSPSSLDAYRVMPECWWDRQLLAYHWRMQPQAAHKLLTLVAQSLRLPQPDATANYALSYAAERSPSLNHTAYWWLAIQAVKLEWQMEQIAPGLQAVMRKEISGKIEEAAVGENESLMSVEVRSHVRPLLSWMFIHHGVYGYEVFPNTVYLELMSNVTQAAALHSWYIGADDLLTPDKIRLSVSVDSSRMPNTTNDRFFSSILIDALKDRAELPLSGSRHSESVAQFTDGDRSAVGWRILLDLAVAQVADAFISTWSSNIAKMAYELGTAFSEERATAPFIGLDMMKEHSKSGVIDGC